ncbi:MAG: DUF4080 domain-containing protein [Candidatus Tenebribacter davisii]|nr:DUF4080 domain-containing protein [Candidatus Tenebribacter davisii]
MKNLLLVGINARYTHLNLAIRYLRNYVKDLNYTTKILEFSINQNILEILEYIVKEQPNIIAFSVYIWNTEKVRLLLPELKKLLPESKVIMGGPEVSYDPHNWLKEFPEIDFIICGAGESGLRSILENNLNISERVIKKKNPHFSEIPFPYLAADFPEINDKYIYYESSRGCSFKCSYCLSSRLDQALEFRDTATVKEELLFLIKQKPRILKFVDRTFNANKKHARDIWNFLIDLAPDMTFHFEIYPELLEDKDLQILKNSPKGLFQFELGIQSTNPDTLKAIHRANNWQKTTDIIKRLISLENIHIHVDMIAGLPYEDIISFERSFNDIFKLQADNFQLGFLKVLQGTEMAENADNFGIVATKISPYIILKSNWLSFTELNKIHKIETLLNEFSNSNKFNTTLKHLILKYDSPYMFFKQFLTFLQIRKFDLQTKNWQKKAEKLVDFINTDFPKSKEFFFDCLRWDWCLQARSHYYPEFIKNDVNYKAKQIGYEYLSSLKLKDKIKLNSIELSVSDIKKVIYFIPVTDRFKQEHLPTSNIAAFLHGKQLAISQIN